MAASRPLMFHRLAEYYDALVAEKDYRSEARFLEKLVRRMGRSTGRAWLDVACGTGRHLEFLRHAYRITGVDLSAEMLRVARRRLPGARLVRGDMRRFRLEETFDVVSCLFSAVGHLRTERDLRAAIRNLARHLRPGGILLVEPWIDPSEFRSGYVHVFSHASPAVTVARMSVSSRRGNHSVLQYHYLIGQPGRRIRYLRETDVGLLVGRDRFLEILRAAGLVPRFWRRGLTPGRGLFVGVKPSSVDRSP